jgi:thymidylate synthase ThyX
MSNKYGVIAKLVWDGGNTIMIPDDMGKPAGSQMAGTVIEQLSEIAGRVCYDSLGKGRSSADFHKHILEVGHFSVYEHGHLTVELPYFTPRVFLNRPGIWVKAIDGPDHPHSRVTINPRVILDWNSWTKSQNETDMVGTPFSTGDYLAYHAEKAFPHIVGTRERHSDVIKAYDGFSRVVPPVHDEEKWVTMFLGGSRGFSHELVRHGDFTAISQRSTRYVDEDGSPWVDHPLVQEYLEHLRSSDDDHTTANAIKSTKNAAQEVYRLLTNNLQTWLLSRGIDKFTARKQARGAARGYLGNALWTEIIFSASIGQWKRMMKMRCCDPADAEIRAVFVDALAALKVSAYADDFKNFRLVPASDKLGYCAIEGAIT